MTENNIKKEIITKAILAAADCGEYDCESSMKELSELPKPRGRQWRHR